MSPSTFHQVRKNANQTPPRINTARQVLIVSSARIDGPGSAWRASFGVSIIMPCFLMGMKISFNFFDNSFQLNARFRCVNTRSRKNCSRPQHFAVRISALRQRGRTPGPFRHHPVKHQTAYPRLRVVAPLSWRRVHQRFRWAALPESCGRAGICSPGSVAIGFGIGVSLLNPSAWLSPASQYRCPFCNLGTYAARTPNRPRAGR
jgi:hypothetical protein